MLVEGNYLLLYEYVEISDVIDLVAVVDGRQDLAEFF
jgi:pantothenate kinase